MEVLDDPERRLYELLSRTEGDLQAAEIAFPALRLPECAPPTPSLTFQPPLGTRRARPLRNDLGPAHASGVTSNAQANDTSSARMP